MNFLSILDKKKIIYIYANKKKLTNKNNAKI